jgi:hypothetical protein
MDHTYRRGAAIAIFMTVLATELYAVMMFLPDIPGQDFDDFMLVSMGLAFIPLLLAFVVAAALLVMLILIAFLSYRLFLRLVKANSAA